jgi:hypothetical protein
MSSQGAFYSWMHDLRAEDPAFAEASERYPLARQEWQAAVYLLSGSFDLWRHFGPMTIADGHLGLVATEALALYGFDEEGEPRADAPTLVDRQNYTGSDHEVLSWTQFLWTNQWIEGTPHLPRSLDRDRYARWHAAILIRRGQAPAY